MEGCSLSKEVAYARSEATSLRNFLKRGGTVCGSYCRFASLCCCRFAPIFALSHLLHVHHHEENSIVLLRALWTTNKDRLAWDCTGRHVEVNAAPFLDVRLDYPVGDSCWLFCANRPDEAFVVSLVNRGEITKASRSGGVVERGQRSLRTPNRNLEPCESGDWEVWPTFLAHPVKIKGGNDFGIFISTGYINVDKVSVFRIEASGDMEKEEGWSSGGCEGSRFSVNNVDQRRLRGGEGGRSERR